MLYITHKYTWWKSISEILLYFYYSLSASVLTGGSGSSGISDEADSTDTFHTPLGKKKIITNIMNTTSVNRFEVGCILDLNLNFETSLILFKISRKKYQKCILDMWLGFF